MESTRTRALWLVLALAPSVLAVSQLGRLHPDEVYQYLEPAFWRAHGYGILAWEWKSGLRNWAYPLLLSAMLRLGSALGLLHPLAARTLVALPQLVLHAASLVAVHRWVRRRSEQGADLALLAVGAQGVVLAYAGRTLGESLSIDLLWLAFEALDRPVSGRSAGLRGGIYLGLAVVTRYATAAAVVGVLGSLVWRRSRGQDLLRWTLVGGAAVAIGLGALDWLTWGRPFHSVVAYLNFNVFSAGASREFGADSPVFYLAPLLTTVPVWAWVALVRSRWGGKDGLSIPLVAAFAYTGALVLAGHKEERFVYPLAELLAFAAAAGLARAWADAAASPTRRLLLGGFALAGSALTWTAVPDVRGDEFRGLVRIAQNPDAQGVLIVNEGLWGAGGYFYIGRPIVWLTCDWPRDVAFQHAMQNTRFNRAVTFEGRALPELQASGFRVIDQVGRETLLARGMP